MRSAGNKRKVGRPKNSTICDEQQEQGFQCSIDSAVGSSRSKNDMESGSVRNLMQDVSLELKHDLEKMSTKLNRVFVVMNALVDRVEELEKIVQENSERTQCQERRIIELEWRTEEQDRKTALNKVLLTYEKINTSSNSLRADVSKILTAEMKISPEVVNGIVISKFGRGNHTVMLELSSLETKREIFRGRKNLSNDDKIKYRNLYVNEFLTRKKAELLKKARDLKKNRRIHTAFSFNGKVYIKLHVDDDKIIVRDMSDLLKIN
jgi:hypothetical protein